MSSTPVQADILCMSLFLQAPVTLLLCLPTTFIPVLVVVEGWRH
jgi:hypothetical protein